MEFTAMNTLSTLNKKLAVIFLTFIFFLISTFAAWTVAKNSVGEEHHRRFYADTQRIRNWLQERFNAYVDFSYGMQGFFTGTQEVTRNEWASYVKQTKIMERYPGLSSVSFAQRVKKSDRDTFIKQVRSDKSASASGYPGFDIYPKSEKDEYFVIKYIEPIDTQRSHALGYDISSEEKRLEAILRAARSGEVTSPGKLTIITTGKSGFSLLAPVYKNPSDSLSEEERQTALTGFVYLTFRENAVFDSVFGNSDPFPDIDFELYDGKGQGDNNLLYDHDPAQKIADITSKMLKTSQPIKLNGESWELMTAAKPTYKLTKSQELLPKVVLAGGVFLSFLILIFFLLVLKTRRTKPD